jgi:hypothetical protein
VQRSSLTKQSFLPARSSVAEGPLPPDPYSDLLQHNSWAVDAANGGNNKVGSPVYRRTSEPCDPGNDALKFKEQGVMRKGKGLRERVLRHLGEF